MSTKKVTINSVVGGAVLLGGIGSPSDNLDSANKNYVADTYSNSNSAYTEPVESSIIESSSVTNQPEISDEKKTGSSTSDIIPSTSLSSSSSSRYSSKQQQGRTYVLNTSTKVIHFSYCRDVKKIAMRNYSTTTALSPIKHQQTRM